MRVSVHGQEARRSAICAVDRDVVDIGVGRLDDEMTIASVALCPEAERPHRRCRVPMIVPMLVLLVLGAHVLVVITGEEQHRDRSMGGAGRIGHRTLDVHVDRGDLRSIAGGAKGQHAARRKARDGNAGRVDRKHALQCVDQRGEEPDVVDVLLLRGAAARAGVPGQPEASESARAVRRREDESIPICHGVHLRLTDDVGAVVVVPVEEDDQRIPALRRKVRREVQVEAAVQASHANRVARGGVRSSVAERMVRLERCAGATRNEQEDAYTRQTGRHLQPA